MSETAQASPHPRGEIMEWTLALAIGEHLIPPSNTADQSLIADLEMLVMTEGGRERSLEEFDQLFSASGLRRSNVIETGLPWRIIEASK